MERRKFIRFKVLSETEFKIRDDKKDTPLLAKVIDFSREGLRLFISESDFLKDNLLTLRVYLPNRPSPIIIQAEVRLMRLIDTCWQLGMKIREINPEEKEEILNYAYNIWKEEK